MLKKYKVFTFTHKLILAALFATVSLILLLKSCNYVFGYAGKDFCYIYKTSVTIEQAHIMLDNAYNNCNSNICYINLAVKKK